MKIYMVSLLHRATINKITSNLFQTCVNRVEIHLAGPQQVHTLFWSKAGFNQDRSNGIWKWQDRSNGIRALWNIIKQSAWKFFLFAVNCCLFRSKSSERCWFVVWPSAAGLCWLLLWYKCSVWFHILWTFAKYSVVLNFCLLLYAIYTMFQKCHTFGLL